MATHTSAPATSSMWSALRAVDAAARAWLRCNTRVLSVASDTLRSLALLTPHAGAEYRAQIAATLVALVQIYRDFPPDPPRRASRTLLVLNLLSAVQLLVEMAVTRRAAPFETLFERHLDAQRDANAALRNTFHNDAHSANDAHAADRSDPPSAEIPLVGDNPSANFDTDRHFDRDRARAPVNTLTLIEAAKAALRLSLLWPRAREGRMLSAAEQQLPEAPPEPVCTCGSANLAAARLVAVTKGPRTDRTILRLRSQRFSKRTLTAAARPISTANIAGLEPPPSVIVRHLDAHPDPLLDALFVVAYERRSNWLVRVFMPDVHCDVCSGVVQMTPPPLAETVDGIQRAVSALKPGELAAEAAYILRPLFHLLLIRRFGWRSWKAWMLALCTDLASRAAMPHPTDEADALERRRRMAQLLLYLGRSPLFDLLLRVVIRRITTPLRKVPFVGGAASSAIQWVTLLQQYWFYTSGS